MHRRAVALNVFALSMVCGLFGCVAPDASSIQCRLQINRQCGGIPVATCLDSVRAVSHDQLYIRFHHVLDILFVLDNSVSMRVKQAQLTRVLPAFVQALEKSGDDYHLGVITTDIGTLPSNGAPFPGPNDPRCATQNGDDGILQNTSCRARTRNVSAEFTAACSALCPAGTQLPAEHFITRESGLANVADPVAAFGCMALVGDGGCDVEAPLEATKRALDGHAVQNAGFLRPDSTLIIIYITDEDDSSVKLSERGKLSPFALNCGQSNPDPDYVCYNLDYRPLAKDIQCNEPLNTAGPKTGCQERSDSFLEPVENYVQFLLQVHPLGWLELGGILPPSILDFNDGRSTPFGNGQLIVDSQDPNMPKSYATDLLNRGAGAKAACQNPDPALTTDPQGYFGQAQLRLSTFRRQLDGRFWLELSICDPARYGDLVKLIPSNDFGYGVDCLSIRPDFDCNGQPICLVGAVDESQPNALPEVYWPSCSSACCSAWASSPSPVRYYNTNGTQRDPAIDTACAPEPADCYCAVESTRGLCTDTALIGAWKKGGYDLPDGKILSFRCGGTPAPSPPY